MKKRLEDKLAMLAFGDLSPEETRLLEQEIAGDAEATGLLEDYRNMRGGLKAMANIPEHQLSTERLRDAILNQGLKPKPAKPQFGWLWMPAAAMVLAFSIMVVRNMNTTGMPTIGSPVADAAHSNAGEQLPDSVLPNPRMENAFAFATASGEIMSVEQTQPKATMVLHHRSHRQSEGDDTSRLEALNDAIQKEFENMASTPPQPVVTALASETKASTAKRTAVAKSDEAPIVLIDSAKDKTTGAQRATEVDSASNVLVGG